MTYSVLIVDDEFSERDGLRFLLEQTEYELALYDATSGEEALKVLSEHAIDILITDICMPYMNGLDLMSEVRKLSPDIVIMVYSAYGEFEFARRAIQENVASYVLKPIDPEDFQRVFKHCVQSCNETRMHNSNRLIAREYFQKNSADRDTLWHAMIREGDVQQQMWNPDGKDSLIIGELAVQLMLVSFPSPLLKTHTEAFGDMAGHLCDGWWLLDDSRAMLIITSAQPAKEAELIELGRGVLEQIEKRFDARASMLIAQPAPGESIIKAFNAMDLQFEQHLFKPGSVSALNERMKLKDWKTYEQLNQIAQDTRGYATVNDFRNVLMQLELLMDMLNSQADISALYAWFGISEIVKYASALFGYTVEEQAQLIEDIWRSGDLSALIVWLRAFTDKLRDIAEASGGILANDHAVVNSILEIIHERFGDDITLESIAQSVYMGQSYVSHLFKKYTGQTLIRYLNRYRITRAAKYLLESDKPITEIMQAVGFNNSSYFGAIFRTQYGLTPSQYRKRKGA